MTDPKTEARAIASKVVDLVRAAIHGAVVCHGEMTMAEVESDAADIGLEVADLIATALAAKDAELAELRAYAFEATKAITSLTVGGSEFFGKRVGEMYTADLPYCVEHIKDRERRSHKRWLEEREKRQRAEAQLAEARKALDGLLEPFEGDDCRYDHHGYCQAHFLQEGDECCVKIARRVREGGKVDG